MGFTIGGLRELRDLRRTARRLCPGRVPLGAVVAECTGRWGWDVVPGARASVVNGRPRCSCAGGPRCPAPGAHPLDPSLVIPAGAPPGEALDAWRAAWRRGAGASVLLPAGARFDVLDVPEAAGRRALAGLERMGLPLGPVAAAPHGRAWFFVAPGSTRGLDALLYRLGWDGAELDVRRLGPGAHVTAPPADHRGLGPVRWLRRPDAETAAAPPPARLLLGTLAYACHRAVAPTGHAARAVSR
jgi:hypothetical protein